MKRSKFTEEQILFGLKQVELGTSVSEVCWKHCINSSGLLNNGKVIKKILISSLKIDPL
ncbi:transposase [Legionella sp. 31fI33]|uniref:transposase n=1 Tax=Legionella sp. 31fI33 TaxID=2886376 RepID=UPI00351D4CC7